MKRTTGILIRWANARRQKGLLNRQHGSTAAKRRRARQLRLHRLAERRRAQAVASLEQRGPRVG